MAFPTRTWSLTFLAQSQVTGWAANRNGGSVSTCVSQYAPSLHNFEGDVITDYQNHKYLLALKADGFELLRNTPLSYLEVHLGYYARGYDNYQSSSGDDDRERTLYVGLGLNVGKLIESIWETRVFIYLQLPYTYVPLEHNLD
jgi:hypothetical protein